MEGISVIYCFVVLAAATMTQKVLIAIASLVILGVGLFIINRRSNLSIRKAIKAFRFSFGSSFDESIDFEDSPIDEKKEIKLEDYHQDHFDEHLFVSLVDTRLKVREINHKNRDVRTYATSVPHCFDNQQVEAIGEKIREIISIKFSSHELIVKKSPAASFFVSAELKGMIFSQLHRVYASRFFHQRLALGTANDNGIIVNFLDFDVEENFAEQLLNRSAIGTACLVISMSDKPNRRHLTVIKEKDKTFTEFKADILSVISDYFPAGVEISGEWPKDKVSDVWKLISEGQDLIIEALDGRECISTATEVFKAGISSTFRKIGFNESGPATPEIAVEVGEMIADASYQQLFASINPDLDKLALTQAQIIRFCKKYGDWIRKNKLNTCFLMKKPLGKKYFVVYVWKEIESDNLGICADCLDKNDVLRGEWYYHGVFPKSTLSKSL